MKSSKWSDTDIEFLMSNFDELTACEIAKKLNRTTDAVNQKRHELSLKKTKGIGVKTIWTTEMIDFIHKNYHQLTNKQIAQALGLNLTNVRAKLYSLGLQRVKYDSWTAEQVSFLIENFQTKGDVEIAIYFNQNMPKSYKWTNKMIRKKRLYLNLYRTKEEVHQIMHQNATIGTCNTIINNSASINLPDNFVAIMIAGGTKKLNKQLKEEILSYKELIELKRNQIKLSRECKKIQQAQTPIN